MILLLSAVAGLLAGLLTGGSFKWMKLYPLRGLALPIAAFLVKTAAAYFLPPQRGAVLVCILQYALLFAFVLLNIRRAIWPALVFLGSLGNFLVILLNGGCMPVSAELLGSHTDRFSQLGQGGIYAYCLMNESTKLSFLGDILRVGPSGLPFGFASVGDVVLCAGVALLCYRLVRRPRTGPADTNQAGLKKEAASSTRQQAEK